MSNNRKTLIKEIEDARKSHVLTYVLGDRHPVSTSIAEDAVRTLYGPIRKRQKANEKNSKLDVFIYSRGGDTSVPWRIISMFREHYNEVNILVPYKAHSAATMICLGADNIFMGKKAELGPIDPTLQKKQNSESANPPTEISVEDVNSYVSFVKNRANITDQESVTKMIELMASNISPLNLGKVARTHSHIRFVAEKLLSVQKKKYDEQRMHSIVETLCEKIYSHGHAIGRQEALDLGLPVKKAESIKIGTSTLEEKMWELYLEYETELNLCNPIDLDEVIHIDKEDEKKFNDLVLGAIESQDMSYLYKADLNILKIRAVPQSVQVTLGNINLNLALPQGTNPNQINQQQLQQAIQQAAQAAKQQASQGATQAIKGNCPVKEVRTVITNKGWKENNSW